MVWYRHEGDDLVLWLKVQPKSSRDEFAEVLHDALKLRITAPPVDGKANKHLTAWLAGEFGVPRSNVLLESGQTQRRKLVRIVRPRKMPRELALLGV
jgi:uncharacterized protein (TIGR00251 family)